MLNLHFPSHPPYDSHQQAAWPRPSSTLAHTADSDSSSRQDGRPDSRLGQAHAALGSQAYVDAGAYNNYYHTPPLSANERRSSLPGMMPAYTPAAYPHPHESLNGQHAGTAGQDRQLVQSKQIQHVQQAHRQPPSRTSSRPASPVKFSSSTAPEQPPGSRHHPIAPYLLLPPEIANGRQGSLAEFAAQITCLLWFESVEVLQRVEYAAECPVPLQRLAQDAFPSTGFLKWVTTMLTTTQVSNNVVLLALKFIYRLKKQNLSVKGKVGSEFRLLTVALMLGNKFLDDNTYTNKTWAEVAGISVHEIHVMEVEFLSHMKYNLYTSRESWQDWFKQLNRFWTYFDRASKKLTDVSPLASRPALQIPYALPSPPASTTASPPFVNGAGVLPHPHMVQLTPSTVSPPASTPEQDTRDSLNLRKRSWDDAAEPAAKRQHVAAAQAAQAQAHAQRAYAAPTLPIPLAGQHLSQPLPQALPQTLPQALLPQMHSYPARMPQVGPQGNNWLQAVSGMPGTQGMPPLTPLRPPQPQPQQQPQAFYVQDGPRLHTPVSASAYAAGPPSAPALTPQDYRASLSFDAQPQLSPSHYLSRRSSPYRPVQHMRQLVQAPPSQHMARHPAHMSNSDIVYQPLKKNVRDDDYRRGTVPYDRSAWPQYYQQAAQPQQLPHPASHLHQAQAMQQHPSQQQHGQHPHPQQLH